MCFPTAVAHKSIIWHFIHRCVCVWIGFAELCSIFFPNNFKTHNISNSTAERTSRPNCGWPCSLARTGIDASFKQKKIDKKTHLCCSFIRFAVARIWDLASCFLFLGFRTLTRTRLFSFLLPREERPHSKCRSKTQRSAFDFNWTKKQQHWRPISNSTQNEYLT